MVPPHESSSSSYTNQSTPNGYPAVIQRENILLTGRRKVEYSNIYEDDGKSTASTSTSVITLMVPYDATFIRRRTSSRRRPAIGDAKGVPLKSSECQALRMQFPRNSRNCRHRSFIIFAHYILQMVLNAIVLSVSVASALPLQSTRLSAEPQLSRVILDPLSASAESAESRFERRLPRHALPGDDLVDEAALQSYRQILDICTTTAANAFLHKRSGKASGLPAKRMRRTWRSTRHRRSAPPSIDSLLDRLCHEVLTHPQTERRK